MKILGIVTGLVVLGCGSDDGEPRPTSCDPEAERVGTYLVHSVERPGGDCGPIEDHLARLGASSSGGGASDCAAVGEPVLSNGDCTLEQTVRCALPSGDFATSNAITTQTKEDGSVLEGSLDLVGEDARGEVFCHSLYDVSYTRQ